MYLIRSAYAALPPGGAFVAIEALIDDARRQKHQGKLVPLNTLSDFGGTFDYTGADLRKWCGDVGFQRLEVTPIVGPPVSAALVDK